MVEGMIISWVRSAGLRAVGLSHCWSTGITKCNKSDAIKILGELVQNFTDRDMMSAFSTE